MNMYLGLCVINLYASVTRFLCYLDPVFHPQFDAVHGLGLPLVGLPVPRRLDQVVLHQHQAVLHVRRHPVGGEPSVHLWEKRALQGVTEDFWGSLATGCTIW